MTIDWRRTRVKGGGGRELVLMAGLSVAALLGWAGLGSSTHPKRHTQAALFQRPGGRQRPTQHEAAQYAVAVVVAGRAGRQDSGRELREAEKRERGSGGGEQTGCPVGEGAQAEQMPALQGDAWSEHHV